MHPLAWQHTLSLCVYWDLYVSDELGIWLLFLLTQQCLNYLSVACSVLVDHSRIILSSDSTTLHSFAVPCSSLKFLWFRMGQLCGLRLQALSVVNIFDTFCQLKLNLNRVFDLFTSWLSTAMYSFAVPTALKDHSYFVSGSKYTNEPLDLLLQLMINAFMFLKPSLRLKCFLAFLSLRTGWRTLSDKTFEIYASKPLEYLASNFQTAKNFFFASPFSSLSLNLSLTHSLSLSHSLTHSLSHSHSLTISLVSLCLSLSLSRSLALSLSRSPSISKILSL